MEISIHLRCVTRLINSILYTFQNTLVVFLLCLISSPAGAKAGESKSITLVEKNSPLTSAVPNPVSGDGSKKDWTVMVYLNGDNNLEPFALIDMEEMRKGADPSTTNLLVLVDRASGYTKEDGDWQDTRYYQLVSDEARGNHWKLLAQRGEGNMGDPAMLAGFIEHSVKDFPADRYGLILWDHGGGWSNHSNDDLAPGVPGSQDFLSLPELHGALSAATRSTGISKLDLLGFDMCLMAQLEIMTELKDLADYMIASEAVEPGDGWPYNTVMKHFSKAIETSETGKRIVASFNDYYVSRSEPVHTLSLFKLDQVPALIHSLDAVLEEINRPDQWQPLTRSIYFSESYYDLGDSRRGTNALQSIDLMDLFQNYLSMVPEFNEKPSWKKFVEDFNSVVLTTQNSPVHKLSKGISIYAPIRSELMNNSYQTLELSTSSNWAGMIQSLHAAQKGNSSNIEISNARLWSASRQQEVPDIIQFGQDGFEYTTRTKNALRAVSWKGKIDRYGRISLFSKSVFGFHQEADYERLDRRTRLKAVKGYSLADGKNTIFDRFDGSRLLVSDGSRTISALIDQSDISARENGYYYARVIYDHPSDGRYEGTLRFNWLWEADNLTLTVPQKDGLNSYININPRPDAIIHFVSEVFDSNGNIEDHIYGSLIWGRGLSLTLDLLPVGKYTTLFGIEDLAGNMTFKRQDFDLSARADQFVESLNVKDLTPDNLTGVWKVIDAGPWFERQKIVDMGGHVEYRQISGYDNLLEKRVFKGKEQISPDNLVTVIPTSGLAHLRDYVLNDDDEPDPGWGTRVGLPVFDKYKRKYLLLTMDLNDGSVGVMVKKEGPNPVLTEADPGKTTDSSSNNNYPGTNKKQDKLTGRWASADGVEIVFDNGIWGMYSYQGQIDGGGYQLDGKKLRTQSQYNGEINNYRIQILGKLLWLQSGFGEVYEFYRVN